MVAANEVTTESEYKDIRYTGTWMNKDKQNFLQ
jgi:hypothetical protein